MISRKPAFSCRLATGLIVWILGSSCVFSQQATVHEGFAYPSGPLQGNGGGEGWKEGWQVLEGKKAEIDSNPLDVQGLKIGDSSPSPEHLRLQGGEIVIVARKLNQAIDMRVPGEYYFSLLYRCEQAAPRIIIHLGQTNRTGGGSQVRLEKLGQKAFSVGLRVNGTWEKNQAGATDLSRSKENPNPVETGLLVVHVKVSEDLKTVASLWQIQSGKPIPESAEAAKPSWSAEGERMDASLNWFTATIQKAPEGSVVDLDEFRLGSTWESVTK